MNEQNLFILTVYIICVLYIFYLAVRSVEEKVIIKLDEEAIKKQLEGQKLQDVINISLKLEKEYKLDTLRELSIKLENKSQQNIIYVDWDRSVVTDFEGRSRRIIRIIPGMTLDLSQPQVYSVITSGKFLKENFTAEDVLTRDKDTGALKITSILFDIDKLKKNDKNLYNSFITRTKPLQFSLRILLWIFEPVKENSSDSVHIISCDFTVQKMRWTEAVRWKPKQDERK